MPSVKKCDGFQKIAMKERIATTDQIIAQKRFTFSIIFILLFGGFLFVGKPEKEIGGTTRHFANDINPFGIDSGRYAVT